MFRICLTVLVTPLLFATVFSQTAVPVYTTSGQTPTTNRLAFFTGTTSIGNSLLSQDAANYMLKLENIFLQQATDADNGYNRGGLSWNMTWNYSTNLWNVYATGYNDFAAIHKLNTGGGLAFYLHNGTANTAFTFTNSQLSQYEVMRLTTTGLGVGVSSPAAKFDVKLGNDNDKLQIRRASSTGKSQLVLSNESGTELWRFGLLTGGSDGFSFYDGTRHALLFQKNGNITFEPAGQVNIGTNSANKNLFVYGTIQGKEVYVTTTASDWPDYVFSSGYELSSLSQVSQFVRQNGHLPEMPSAAEVEENGIELGVMNKLLLKKVEELTLHMIEQEKRINELEAEVRKNKKQ